MRLITLALLVGCSSDTGDDTGNPDATPNLPTHWETLEPMPTPRNGLGCTAVGEAVYAIAGFGVASDPYRQDLEVLIDGTWDTLEPMPVARDYFVTAPRTDGAFAVLGGFSAGSPDTIFLYDPDDDDWSNLGSASNRIMPAGGAIDGDFAVVAGGSYDWSLPTDDTEIVDLVTGEVTTAAAAPDAFVWGAAAGVGDKLYVSGGTDTAFSVGTMDALWVYDATADEWEELSPLPIEIDGHAMVALHDHLFVIGGYDASASGRDSVWRYDIAADSWEEADPLPDPLTEACAVVVGDDIVVLGGTRESGDDPLDEVLAYVP